MRPIAPHELAALDLIHRHFTRSAKSPSPSEWSAWADTIILASKSPPPGWLCDLSLGKLDDGLAAWLRQVFADANTDDADLSTHLLFAVWFVLFKAGRLSLAEL